MKQYAMKQNVKLADFKNRKTKKKDGARFFNPYNNPTPFTDFLCLKHKRCYLNYYPKGTNFTTCHPINI